METPLIVTRDERLLDELLRLAAAAGVLPEVAADPGAALGAWRAAPLVVVGTDAAADLAAAAPPPRAGVQLVGWERVDDRAFRHAVALGAEQVSELPGSAAWLLELFAECSDGPRADGRTIAVVGGSGGAGATTFACTLGVLAAMRGPACLLDTDPLGPGVERVLGFDGLDGSVGAHWGALEHATGRVGARSLHDTLPRRQGLGVLTWAAGARTAPQVFAVREALAAAARGHRTVISDLQRSGPVTGEVVQRVGQVVVVVRPTLPGIAAAARVVAGLGSAARVGLVVRGDAHEAAVAELVGAPVLAVMPDQRGLDEAIGLGRGPAFARRGHLVRAARRVLDQAVPA